MRCKSKQILFWETGHPVQTVLSYSITSEEQIRYASSENECILYLYGAYVNQYHFSKSIPHGNGYRLFRKFFTSISFDFRLI